MRFSAHGMQRRSLGAVLRMEATALTSVPGRVAADRWPYLLTALLFAVVAIIGFARNSVAIATGAVPDVALIVHVHAALMTAWLVLLLVQTASMSTGRRRLHVQLGLFSLALAPAMVVAMIFVTLQAVTARLASDFPEAGAAVFYVWAVLTRRSAPETHKRMMVMATFVLIDAGILRMPWLPGNDLWDSRAWLELITRMAGELIGD
jgi:hypothetical protein